MLYDTPGIKNRFIIDEKNCHEVARDVVVGGRRMRRGYRARNWSDFPEGSFATPFPLPVIPESEWPDRIEEKDKNKAWPKDHKMKAGGKSKNQNPTNYCWVNAPVQGVQYVEVMQTGNWIELSAASVGAPIKNYRNVGGWGSQALKYLIEHGAVPVDLWPANAINKRYDTEESREARKQHKVLEWWELQPRNFAQLVSCLLYGFPVAIGLNWWGHEVLACALAIRGREVLVDFDNSWGTGWGDNGHGLLVPSKANPDDAVAPRVITPSDLALEHLVAATEADNFQLAS